jgi:hypothetical protein
MWGFFESMQSLTIFSAFATRKWPSVWLFTKLPPGVKMQQLGLRISSIQNQSAAEPREKMDRYVTYSLELKVKLYMTEAATRSVNTRLRENEHYAELNYTHLENVCETNSYFTRQDEHFSIINVLAGNGRILTRQRDHVGIRFTSVCGKPHNWAVVYTACIGLERSVNWSMYVIWVDNAGTMCLREIV